MPLFPLTPFGVSEKLDELYSLPDALLALQANAVRADFRLWMEGNFCLEPAEAIFLDEMDQGTVSYLGERLGFCFIHRLLVSLQKTTPPGQGSKWLRTLDKTKTATSALNGLIVTGSFEVEIVYIL